jgi:hypothetical protein
MLCNVALLSKLWVQDVLLTLLTLFWQFTQHRHYVSKHLQIKYLQNQSPRYPNSTAASLVDFPGLHCTETRREVIFYTGKTVTTQEHWHSFTLPYYSNCCYEWSMVSDASAQQFQTKPSSYTLLSQQTKIGPWYNQKGHVISYWLVVNINLLEYCK